jgi:hypothetical protein
MSVNEPAYWNGQKNQPDASATLDFMNLYKTIRWRVRSGERIPIAIVKREKRFDQHN